MFSLGLPSLLFVRFIKQPPKRKGGCGYNGSMKILLSPAKKMRICDDHPFALSAPLFMEEHDSLMEHLLSLPPADLQKVWKVSDALFEKNLQALQAWKQKTAPATPALLSYDGIAFQTMAPSVFDEAQWDYVNAHLRILSAAYGLLRPLDAICGYRLEMQQKIPFSLYEFWGCRPAEALEDDVIVNLASKEYSRLISAWKPVIDVRFFEEEQGKRREKGVYAKMARGAMVRWMAANRIENPEGMKAFDELGYTFDPEASGPFEYVFVRPSAPGGEKS